MDSCAGAVMTLAVAQPEVSSPRIGREAVATPRTPAQRPRHSLTHSYEGRHVGFSIPRQWDPAIRKRGPVRVHGWPVVCERDHRLSLAPGPGPEGSPPARVGPPSSAPNRPAPHRAQSGGGKMGSPSCTCEVAMLGETPSSPNSALEGTTVPL